MKLLKYRSVRLASILIILSVLAQVGLQYALGFLVVDRIEEMKNVIYILALIVVFVVLSLYISLKMKARAEYFVIQDLRQKLDKALASMSYEEYNEKDQGERLSSYINDLPKIRELVLDKYFSMINFLFTGIWTFLALSRIHISVVLVALGSAVLMLVIPSFLQKELTRQIANLQEGKEAYTGKMRELLQGLTVFIENSALVEFLEKTRLASSNLSKIRLKERDFTSFMSASLTLLNVLTSLTGLAIMSYFVIKGQVRAGALVSVITLLPNFGAGVVQFVSERQFYKSGQDLYKAKFSKMIKEDYEEENFYKGFLASKDLALPEEKDLEKPQELRSIELENIGITYKDKNINFPTHILFERGKKYGILGESGSGKSTLLKVILGQIGTYRGNKKVNGQVYNKDLYDEIAYIRQDTFLFNDTIRNNVDIRGLHDDRAIEEVLEKLNLGDFSLDYRLKDNGKNLSGGQRQRLSIARAILSGKDILIIDEGTSSLDKENRDMIEAYLFDLFPTIIMVTHNLTEDIEKRLDQKIILG